MAAEDGDSGEWAGSLAILRDLEPSLHELLRDAIEFAALLRDFEE